MADRLDGYHRVCAADDLPVGASRIVTVGNTEIGIYNVSGRLFGLTNVCPHAGAPLCLGRVSGTTRSRTPYQRDWVDDGQIVLCPWHGWEFDLATGRTVVDHPSAKPVQRWRVIVDEGSIFVERMRRDEAIEPSDVDDNEPQAVRS